MDTDEPHEYLSSLLNQNLRIHTTDGRIFWGAFKCTDPDRNIVLANTYECRHLPEEEQKAAAVNSPSQTVNSQTKGDMSSRYLGLIVVPGLHIVKIEAEQFLSQMNNTTT